MVEINYFNWQLALTPSLTKNKQTQMLGVNYRIPGTQVPVYPLTVGRTTHASIKKSRNIIKRYQEQG